MGKMIIIEACVQCDKTFTFDGKLECRLEKKVIPDSHSIPVWCPLSDAPLTGNSSRAADMYEHSGIPGTPCDKDNCNEGCLR